MRAAILSLAAVAAVSVFAGRASALTPIDLTPQELVQYSKVKNNPKSAEAFLATRDYVRKSAAVVAAPGNKTLAIGLKMPSTFDERYLMEGDDEVINAAVELSLNALAEKMWA